MILTEASMDPFMLDIVAILSGVKKVAYSFIHDVRVHDVERTAGLLGLAYRRFPVVEPAAGHMVFVARKKAALEKAIALWRAKSPRVVELLGYPDCCARFFDANGGQNSRDLIAAIAANTAAEPPYDFTLNDVFNETGRRDTLKSIAAKIQRIHVLPWHPCSYDCSDSLKAGKKVFSVLKEVAPKAAETFAATLSKTVLYLQDRRRWALLDGARRSSAGIAYLRADGRWMDPELAGWLARGDFLELTRNAIVVSKAGRAIGAYPCRKALVLEFQ